MLFDDELVDLAELWMLGLWMKRTVSGTLRTHQEDGQLMNPAQDRGGRDPSQEPCKVARTEEIHNPSLADHKVKEPPSPASPTKRPSTAGLPLAPKVVNEALATTNPTTMSEPQQVSFHEDQLVSMRLDIWTIQHEPLWFNLGKDCSWFT